MKTIQVSIELLWAILITKRLEVLLDCNLQVNPGSLCAFRVRQVLHYDSLQSLVVHRLFFLCQSTNIVPRNRPMPTDNIVAIKSNISFPFLYFYDPSVYGYPPLLWFFFALCPQNIQVGVLWFFTVGGIYFQHNPTIIFGPRVLYQVADCKIVFLHLQRVYLVWSWTYD